MWVRVVEYMRSTPARFPRYSITALCACFLSPAMMSADERMVMSALTNIAIHILPR